MEKAVVEEKVLDCAKRVLNHSNIEASSDLSNYGVDSMTFIRLVVELEQEYEIEIKDEDIVLDNFVSVGKISNLLDGYISAG